MFWVIILFLFCFKLIQLPDLISDIMFKDFMKSFILFYLFYLWFCWWLRWDRICLQYRRLRFYHWKQVWSLEPFGTWVGKIPWKREWLTTPVFLCGEFYGQRNLVAWHCTELGRTEWLTCFEMFCVIILFFCFVFNSSNCQTWMV